MSKKQSCCSTITTSPNIYEEFQPLSERNEEEGAHILKLHLPDFSREQIRVIYVASKRTITAKGERPLGKWIRFNQSFPVPENCNPENIHGAFGDGILKITIPKQSISPPPPNSASEKCGTQNWTKFTGRDENPTSETAAPTKLAGKEEALGVFESELESEKQGIAESGMERVKGGVFRGKEKAKEEIRVFEAAMKAVMEKKEDRSLIITTGVAVMVIVAVGAYATYKIRSSSQSKG